MAAERNQHKLPVTGPSKRGDAVTSYGSQGKTFDAVLATGN
jgi:hypothetical protein